jgi:hypothetical protein
MIAAAIVLALGLAIYLGQSWPLRALAWAENMAPAIAVGAKAVVKAAVILGTASGLLWAGIAARKN